MKTKFSLGALLLAILATLGFACFLQSTRGPELVREAHGSVDSWSQHTESLQTNTVTLSSTPAVVFTAVTINSVGQIQNIRAMDFSLGTAGILVLQSGNPNSDAGATTIFQQYCAANTPYQLNEDYTGQGIKTTLTAAGAARAVYGYVSGGGALTITARVRLQSQ